MPATTAPTGAGRDRHSVEAMVLHYRPLALSLARRYAAGGHGREDLEQVACEGLVKAVLRFDAHRGCAFTTFAVPTILGELRRFCRDTGWTAHVPRGMQERARSVRICSDELVGSLGRAPTVGELAIELGWSEEDVIEALVASGTRSAVPLDAPISDDQDSIIAADRLGALDPGFDRVECLAVIESSLPALTSSQKQILRLRFEEDLRLHEIADRLHLPEGRVSRLLASALDTLRGSVAEDADGHAATHLFGRRAGSRPLPRPRLAAA